MICDHCHSEISDDSVYCTSCGHNQSAATEPSNYKYAAFISYRHMPRDTEVAKLVQKEIETYRFPKGVQPVWDVNEKSNTASSESKSSNSRTLGKCFRDEDELVASHSLPEKIKQALAESRTLIVICTPDTSQSIWVQREITEFIKLHGRERIIPILADGDSGKSVPDILKTYEALDANNDKIKIEVSPLAADFRSNIRKKQKAETLRVIASIAGIGYDDLIQRQKARHQRNAIIIVVAIIALLSIIISLVALAVTPSKDQLIAQSNELAAQAQQQLTQGDRIGAIETALSALPSSTSDTSIPITEEAQAALKEAVQIDPDPFDVWRPSYLLTVPGTVLSFDSNTNDEWAAIVDDLANVSIFDLETGSLLAQKNLEEFGYEKDEEPDQDGAANPLKTDWKVIAASNYNLIVANRTGAGSLACINAKTGETKWNYEHIVTSAIALSEDESQIVVFSIFENKSFMAAIIDVETSEVIDWAEFNHGGLLEWTTFLPAYLDSENQKAYMGFAGYLFWVDFPKGQKDGVKLDDYMMVSLNGNKSNIVTASRSRPSKTGMNNSYYLTCTSNLHKKWSGEGDYDYDLIGGRYATTSIDGSPKICAFTNIGKPCVIISVGDEVQARSLEDGKKLKTKNFNRTIVGVGTNNAYDENGFDAIYVATTNGLLDIWMPGTNVVNGSSLQTQVPQEIDYATLEWYKNTDFLAILKCANPSNYLLVYRLDLRLPNDNIEMSSDELIELAHEIIAANDGQNANKQLVNQPYSS